jgi:hypothetical protein
MVDENLRYDMTQEVVDRLLAQEVWGFHSCLLSVTYTDVKHSFLSLGETHAYYAVQ